MKKKLFLSVLATLAITANANVFDDTNYIEEWGKLKLNGNQLSSSNIDSPVQLKGWSTNGIHFANVAECMGKVQFSKMKHYGANIVRLSMYIDDDSNGGSYIGNEEKFKDKIKSYIKDCYDLGMYVMVDWNTFDMNGREGNPAKQTVMSQDFFKEISAYCKENGYDNVLYELCGVPNTDSWATIKGYAEEVIPVILENQPDAMIVVGTNFYCQKVMEPVFNPISEYKSNVLYSFHYDACTHYPLLPDFRAAQNSIPVFVSEWSPVNFAKNVNSFCEERTEDFIRDCSLTGDAKQLVSWCTSDWNYEKTISSFMTGSCEDQQISYLQSDRGISSWGNYLIGLMCGRVNPDPDPDENTNQNNDGSGLQAVYIDNNVIPSTLSKAWHWDAYSLGGEGVAYHDENSSAWERDDAGKVVGYRADGEEVDVFSLAVHMQWMAYKFPYAIVENGKVVSFSDTIKTEWKDVNNGDKPTYKSLNAGRKYSGTDGSRRLDEGVDLIGASCAGTDYEMKGYQSLYSVEDGEWMKFVVDVEKAGYYKLSAAVSAEYKALNKDGEISIISDAHGNHLRAGMNLEDETLVKTFGFSKTENCADANAKISEPCDCWAISDAKSGGYDEIFVAFPSAGEQEIVICFLGDASGVGPMMFEYVGPLKEGDPMTSVDQSGASEFTIAPNPTSGEFTITLADDTQAHVDVVNMAGQTVYSAEVETSATIGNSFAPGVYTVIVTTDNGVNTQKLIVK